MATYGGLCIGNRHAHRLTLLMHRRLFCDYESSGEFVYSLLDQPLAHGDPEDNHLRREGLTEKERKVSLDSPLAYSQK
jgi:hypothetical protein